MKPIDEYYENGKLVRIYPDMTPIDPRTYENLGKMICFHKRYELGDDHNMNSDDFSSYEEIREVLEEEKDAEIILPLYLYDHSGITMSTSSFHSHWDSGQVGWIYATKERILSWYQEDELTDELRKKAKKCLRMEVDEYDSFISGEVFTYHIIEKEKCDECGHVEEIVVDSCGGFTDIEYMKEEIKNITS